MTDYSLQPVLSHYGLDTGAVQIEPLANAGGWSGSLLWRITDAAYHQFCLRRWPAEHPTADRLRVIHSVLELVAFELPIVAVPLRTNGGTTHVEHAENRWELTHWLPGQADFHARPSPKRLAAAMEVLARFHLLATRYKRRLIAPAIADRQRLWVGFQQGLPRIENALQTPRNRDVDLPATRLLHLASVALHSWDVLRWFEETPELWLQPAIRDIHHDHVLFTGDEVTGLIDFGAMRIDTPLTDVARLVGSLVADERAMRQAALDSYNRVREISESDRQLVDSLDKSGLILGALNWLTWLYVERRDMGPAEPIVRRLDELIGRLERQSL